MKERTFRAFTALILIITLTMANFILIGYNTVTYAVDMIDSDKKTNCKNVEFMAYFKDENGKNITKAEAIANRQDLTVYFNISVKKEGYFNGYITLSNSNFKFKTDNLDSNINSIKDNEIKLNQINAGEEKEIAVGIEVISDEEFDLNNLNLESQINISGIYRDSKEKDINIEGVRNVTLNIVCPENLELKLNQEVITNKIDKINEEEKRIIQVRINTQINEYPTKSLSLEIKTPKINEINVKDVNVNSIDPLATNGKYINDDNWKYDEKTGILNIDIENEAIENKIKWSKTKSNDIIVTYIFDDTQSQVQEQDLFLKAKAILYDENMTEINNESQIKLDNEVKDNIIEIENTQKENSIYKGKLYAGIDREIEYLTSINVNLENVANEISVIENNQKINEVEIPTYYKQSRINKENVLDILGQEGSLSIYNSKNNLLIKTINNQIEADEEGNILVEYPEDISSIKIITTKAVKKGKIEIQSTKVIEKTDLELAKQGTEILTKFNGNYISAIGENSIKETNSKIELKETESSAKLELSRTELSTMNENNIEIRDILNSRDENNELYKNPILRIELPSKLEKIEISSINLVYEDELKVESAKLVNGNVIEVKLLGEQTHYKQEAIDGTTLIINVKVSTSKKKPTSTDKITLTFTNEKAINMANEGKVEKEIKFVSYAGLVTINRVNELNVETINNEGIKQANIEVGNKSRELNIENEIINNEENTISNVRILGTLPTNDAIKDINNINTIINSISVTDIDSSRVKIYYTENAQATSDVDDINNGWTEKELDTKLIKKYLVLIDKLDVAESAKVTYKTIIPENLDYNKVAEEGYIVFYKNLGIEKQNEVENIKIMTPRGASIDTKLVELVAGEETTDIKENETVRYVAKVTNNGSEDISNVKVNAKVPEGTTLVNNESIINTSNNNEEENKQEILNKEQKEVEFNIDSLKQGETTEKYYEVKINKNTSGNTITNKVVTKYNEIAKESNEVNLLVSEGNLDLNLTSVDTEEGTLQSGYSYRFLLDIKNDSNEDLNNVKVKVNGGDLLTISNIYYNKENEEAIMNEDSDEINVEKIAKNSTVRVIIYANVKVFQDVDTKNASIFATCMVNNKEYKSNEITLPVKSNYTIKMDVQSENEDGYVKAGDTIIYDIKISNLGTEAVNNIELNDWIPNDVTLKSVSKNNENYADYKLESDTSKNKKLITITENSLESKAVDEYKIEVKANLLPGNTKVIELVNEVELNVLSTQIEKNEVKHLLEPDSQKQNTKSNNNNTSNSNNTNNSISGETTNKDSNYKIISGNAWFDENENGIYENGERKIEGIKVKLLNNKTNQFVKDSEGNDIEAITDKDGLYSFTKVTKGEYILIFDYDTEKYDLTTYKKEGVNESKNSNVIEKIIRVNGQDKNETATGVILVEDANVANINIGLINARKFDLQLEKFISKVTIQNNKTNVKEFTDKSLAKVEIDSKQINNTTAVVEYTIKVTNVGNVPGYAKKIVDYLSKDYKFNSELNKDWYQSGSDVYCTGLSDVLIKPGEVKEVKLVVINTLSENNIGLINNTAEIANSYNEYGIKDVNSKEANKKIGENDMGSADLILSIKTGQIVTTIILTITIILIIGLAVLIIDKKYINRKNNIN